MWLQPTSCNWLPLPYSRLDFEQCGDSFHSRSRAGSSLSCLEADSLVFAGVNDKIRRDFSVANNKDRFGTFGTWGIVLVVNLSVQQEYFDILDAIGE